ncbi:MAG: SprT family zinc-dependent metalloprotease [Euryarchaeota archaeon]|nr:SprT family zinc-dependent metalloprotease [Euryarchaeota archaeon]
MFHKKIQKDGLKNGTTIDVVHVNGVIRPVRLFYEQRRNCTVSIGKKAITIRIPLFLNKSTQEKEIAQLKAWAIQRIQDKPERFKPKPMREYQDNETIHIGNEQYLITINKKDKKNSSARLIDHTIHIDVSTHLSTNMQNRHITTLISRCIARHRLPDLEKKITYLNKKYFNQQINNIYFKHNKSNWGSCSQKRNINISTRLLFAPDDVLEYVCIHELAHLVVLNHSDRFWTLVEHVMPDYEEKKQWLKDNRDSCRF